MSFLRKILILSFTIFLFVQCAKENEFLIEKGQVGLLNKQTQVNELIELFVKDSIVSSLSSDTEDSEQMFSAKNDEYVVYSKEGKKMLVIVPEIADDSTSYIKSIQIYDSRFKTEKGLSLLSTFRDINENYMVNNIETTLTSATLFIDELNATVAIDKKELGINPFSRDEITLDQIPDIAKIKYFTVWFN
jgi:hypothetical protein